MFAKLGLYINTAKALKASQLYYRLRKKLNLGCNIGGTVAGIVKSGKPIATVPELDFDPAFLQRFPANETMDDKVTFLHSSKEFHWNQKWHFADRSALWNYNLHYFEFLFSLIDAYKKTGDRKYLDKSVNIISHWIDNNPRREGGDGWAPYTIDLRLTNWLSYFAYVSPELDHTFKEKMINSIHEQYAFLSRHLEKDLLGNHYFEDLKTLVLCAIFFEDASYLKVALNAFHKECKEELLSDGMHFELSPMYHKLVFEGIIRVVIALKGREQHDPEIKQYLQPMLNTAYSLEEGLDRLPLFNDCGNNIAKSLQALLHTCEKHFGMTPEYQSRFEDSGYYIFKQSGWKLIVDAGQPGPAYIPGHAHCDAGSFELFRNGKPVIVNCGTYAYQCTERHFFRSTAAHNTVMINDTEQSQCWSNFRMARRSKTTVNHVDDQGISITITDQCGKAVTRTIHFSKEKLILEDQSHGEKLRSFLHVVSDEELNKLQAFSAEKHITGKYAKVPYAIDYGIQSTISMLTYEATTNIIVTYTLR